MNTVTSCSLLLCLMVITESCMRTVPPDEAYIPVTMAPDECLDIKTSPCGDLESLFESKSIIHFRFSLSIIVFSLTPVEHVEKDGCEVLTCPDNQVFLALSSFDKSEVPRPSEVPETQSFQITSKLTGTDGESITDLLGIICDGDKWMITKYPIGFAAPPAGLIGADGSMDGKKSEVLKLACADISG
ncbi:DUF281 domain-containing protein [Caenorhabditis elegans]|uniref:DUF281 domain-containing protein n=1 Tax=Caenorhabditis elegans TaxID=6239 RepID=O76590_CAEEL|nr:DUF281 domain-containing protein [Caenorhabditis elegans]CCD69610.1 DUF281 domain-containing protein [Caenorhabditis elegans]|eukprot:NP_494259.2 Uncharacterized protein CELE_F16G10.2 [Caenorhabditis elegans]